MFFKAGTLTPLWAMSISHLSKRTAVHQSLFLNQGWYIDAFMGYVHQSFIKEDSGSSKPLLKSRLVH